MGSEGEEDEGGGEGVWGVDGGDGGGEEGFGEVEWGKGVIIVDGD